MSDLMFVKPASADTKVRRPEKNGEHLPAEGAEVPRTAYWHRRLIDNDVVATKPPKKIASKEQ